MTTNKLKAGPPPHLTMVANEKGGQGKSLVGLAITDHAALHDMPLSVAQIDSQARLAKALGRKVLTIDPVEAGARREPNAEVRSFTPLYGMIESAAA